MTPYCPAASPISTRRRTAVKILGLAFMLPLAHAAQSQELALSTAINRSGRLRALSQRSAKAHIQIVLGILPDKSQEIATSAQALIQTCLRELKTSHQKSGQPIAPALLEQVENDARNLLAITAASFTRKSALEVSEQSDKLLASSEKLTSAYTESSRTHTGRLINTAGRQRMLSQRVAKLYFLSNIGHSNEALRRDIQKLRNEFNDNLATLSSAPLHTPSIRAYLELGRTQWLFLDSALNKSGDPAQMRNVATTSERLLEVMNDLANEYEIVLKDIV